MNEKISNTIALHQMSINELKEIKHRVETTESEDVRFRIEIKTLMWVFRVFLHKTRINLRNIHAIYNDFDIMMKQ